MGIQGFEATWVQAFQLSQGLYVFNHFTGERTLDDDPIYQEPPRSQLVSYACPQMCGFAVTWHETHCCQLCAKTHGRDHAENCERKLAPSKRLRRVKVKRRVLVKRRSHLSEKAVASRMADASGDQTVMNLIDCGEIPPEVIDDGLGPRPSQRVQLKESALDVV